MRPLRSRFRLSISARLTLWYGLSLLLLLSLFVVFLYTSFHLSLHQDFEAQLRHDETRLRSAVRIEAGRPALQAGEALRSVALQTEGAAGTYVRLLSPSGDVLYRSPNFAGRPPLTPSLPRAAEPAIAGRAWDAAPARSRYAPLLGDGGRLAGWLEVTRLESALHRELHRLRWLLALGVLLGAAVAIGSGYHLARRALRPVAAITGAAREIGGEELGRRLPADFGVRDELTDLAETLNGLLARLDASFERERRFRADAAHEMFTPLSAIRSEIDVALRKPREAAYYRATLAALEGHAQRLAALVESLLRLSRAEAIGIKHAGRKGADVSEVVRCLIGRFRAPAEAQEVRLACGDLPPGVLAAIDPAHLEAALENLLDNAIKYTPPGGAVTVSASAEGSEAVLRVADTGAGFAEEEAARLFDRFYRADAHPVRQVGGSGLGLSISKAVADVYGGRICARSPGRGFGSTFEVWLPLAEPESAPANPSRRHTSPVSD